jgi:hypothetical protein
MVFLPVDSGSVLESEEASSASVRLSWKLLCVPACRGLERSVDHSAFSREGEARPDPIDAFLPPLEAVFLFILIMCVAAVFSPSPIRLLGHHERAAVVSCVPASG